MSRGMCFLPSTATLAVLSLTPLAQSAGAQARPQRQQPRPSPPPRAQPQPGTPPGAADTAPFAQPKYRYIGPGGNRVSAGAGVVSDPSVYYAGAASGGGWKTPDGGG